MEIEIKIRLKIIENTLQIKQEKSWYKPLINTIKKIIICTMLTKHVQNNKLLKKRKNNNEIIIKINNESPEKPSKFDYLKLETTLNSPGSDMNPKRDKQSTDSHLCVSIESTNREYIPNLSLLNKKQSSNSTIELFSPPNTNKKDSPKIKLNPCDDSRQKLFESQLNISNFDYQQTFQNDSLSITQEILDKRLKEELIKESLNNDLNQIQSIQCEKTFLLGNQVIYDEDMYRLFKVHNNENFMLKSTSNPNDMCKIRDYVTIEGKRDFLFKYLLTKELRQQEMTCYSLECRVKIVNKVQIFLMNFLCFFKYLLCFAIIFSCWIIIMNMFHYIMYDYGYRILYLWLVPNIAVFLLKFFILDNLMILLTVFILFKNINYFRNDEKSKESVSFLLRILPENSKLLFRSIIRFKLFFENVERKNE